MKIAILLTCHDRREKTVNCIRGLSKNKADISFVVVDDGSSDGTVEALEALKSELDFGKELVVIEGDGNLFYSGGMRKAMEYAEKSISADYYVLVNDDVQFDDGILDKITGAGIPKDRVLVGPMRDKNGKCSYGGVKYTRGIHYVTVTPDSSDRSCDTFNANCVVIPDSIFRAVPIMDKHFVHSLGVFDYGLSVKRAGYGIEVLDYYVGICENNSKANTWSDRSLSRVERIRKKESVKGAPFKPWFYFLRKNIRIGYAIIYSITPYIRIMRQR